MQDVVRGLILGLNKDIATSDAINIGSGTSISVKAAALLPSQPLDAGSQEIANMVSNRHQHVAERKHDLVLVRVRVKRYLVESSLVT